MTREAIEYFKFRRKIFCEDYLKICPKDSIAYQATLKEKEFYDMAIKALEQEPCCNCIEFKRYAKQMGFRIEPQSIPYLMHKEMDIPLSECQKAYDVAIDYLRSQGKVKG